MSFFVVLFWLLLSAAVGLWASNHRGRSGIAWFFISLLISPVLGFAFAAASKDHS